jgi:predicted ArsR family transcriptional regulator
MQALPDSNYGLAAPELAELCGLHVSTARFHLGILRESGMVDTRVERRRVRGRPRVVYSATKAERLSAGYQLLAEMLAAQWGDSPGERTRRAEQAGPREALNYVTLDSAGPGTSLEGAVTRLASQFAELGFRPDVSRDGRAHLIRLHACPFRAVAEKSPEVVCSLHLGLIRGALERMGAPEAHAGLEPFVQPDVCLARIWPVTHSAAREPGRTDGDDAP